MNALAPVPRLIERLREEMAHAFVPGRAIRIARAPGRLDVMGGIADYTGSVVCEMPLDLAAAVAVQDRDGGRVGVFSFNLLDDHKPFRLDLPAESLARPLADLRRDLTEPGRQWAAYPLGCLAVLLDEGLLTLDRLRPGLNLAILSDVPVGGGVSSSAAIEVATMNALVDHFDIAPLRDDPLRLAKLCQRAENEVVGAPCGLMDQVASHLGEQGRMLRMRCQPHELLPPLDFPEGVAAIGINTNVEHQVGGGAYGRTRTAAFMGLTLVNRILHEAADAAGKVVDGDPLGGFLANLRSEDYKSLFRPKLPEIMTGRDFLARFDHHGDTATTVEPDVEYRVQAACDHHVLDAQRVRRFCDFLERVDEHGREKALRSAGHLMYASHKSYGDNAGLGSEAADVLVELVKQNESAGLHGARITGGGSGGTVAILQDATPKADAAVEQILDRYRERTGLAGQRLAGSSPGAMHTHTTIA
jgi:L-arabinokinase